MRILVLAVLFFLTACGGQSKEEMVQQGNTLLEQGNARGAIVLYKNALEKDGNFMPARQQLAEAYLRAGQLDRAETEFQKLKLQQPNDAELLLKLATVYIQQRQPEKALLELDHYSESGTESAEALVLYGLAHGSTGDLDTAEGFFHKALKLEPKNSDALLNLAKVRLQRQDYDGARARLQELIAAQPKTLAAYEVLATVEMRSGNPQTALQTYQDLLQVEKRHFRALVAAGQLQLDLGQLDQAEVTLTQLTKFYPEAPETSRLKGMLQFRRQDFKAATQTLQESLKQQAHLVTYFYLGLCHYAQEEYEQALGNFQKALDIHSEFERARLLVAMTLLKQKRLEDAIQEVQRVLKQNPDNAFAQNIYGSALLAAGRFDEGMKALEQATDLNPALVDAHVKKGIVHLSRGEQNLGEQDLINAVKAQPDLLNTRLMLITHYLRQKNYVAAIETIEQGLNGSKTDALLNNYLAAAYFAQKKTDQAIAALEKAKQANPDYLTPYFNLAAYAAAQNHYDQAQTQYDAILSRDPANLKALLALASLHAVQGQDEELDRTFVRIAETGSEQGILTAVQYRLKKKQPDLAGKLLDQGLASFPRSAGLLDIKGRLLQAKKQTAEAETFYKTLAEVNPARGYGLLTGLYLSSGQKDKADQLVSELLGQQPTADYPYLLASSLALSTGDRAKARQQLEDGLKQAEKPQLLQLQLGSLLAGEKNFSAAEEQFTQVLKSAPRSSAAYLALATVKEQQGDKGAALDLYRQAVRFNERNVQALNNLAYLLADNFGEAGEAVRYALQAYRLSPGDPRIMDTLGFVLLRNQRYEDAERLLARAHEMLPDITTVALHLAEARMKTDDQASAAQLLDAVIAAGSDDEVEQARTLRKTLP